ncbi:MAG: hypothetical protein AABY07_00240, partial [Nanoarchaeota archaeon]
MALNDAICWEVRTTGDDANSGGFKTGASGTDRSQQDAAHVTFNGTTVTATTTGISSTMTLAGYTVISGDVGNIIQISGGTNFTSGFYEITSVDTGFNNWTVDRNCSTGVGSG